MSSAPHIVVKEQRIDKDKLSRAKSFELMDNFDVSESNILSSLFDGIPININSPKQSQHSHNHTVDEGEESMTPRMKCVNVISRAKLRSNAIVMATGLREPDEVRIIFKHRPLGIQIKAVNIHGFGAKISKISNDAVHAQGVEENMIITGLNNKDLLGCTFDQIMSIIKFADLPITLRLKKMSIVLPQMNPLQLSTLSSSSSSHTDRRNRIGPLGTLYDVNSLEPPSLTPKDNLMLASFSTQNMPSSTILSSSSDEEDVEQQFESDSAELIEEEEDEDGMSYVQWNHIRLGASVIKYGWALDIDDDEDETTFELAYDTLTRQGLNIYEIRAAIRLIRQQPEQIPPLETFKQLTIHNKRTANSSMNPKFMPQQWLKETNLTGLTSSEDEDADDEGDEDADDEGDEEEEKPSNNIYFDTFMTTAKRENESQPLPVAGYIDFFDDNESSSCSASSSQSIPLQEAMDAIGLKSPCPDVIAYSTDEEAQKKEWRFDDTNGELMVNVATPDEYSTDCMESDEKVIDGIGVSSYICTEGADDLLDNECLPQVMLKYVKEKEHCGLNKFIRGLSIKTNVQSIFTFK
eukprot:5522_1